MAQSNVQGDFLFAGVVVHQQGTIPNNSVNDAKVASLAGIQASKLQQQRNVVYGQPGGAISFTDRQVIAVVNGATGLLAGFKAGSKTACVGAATITLDLQKNGVTMLSAVITLNNANTAYVSVAAALAVTAMVAGDVLEVVVTATAGGGTIGSGVFCEAVFNEDPA